MRRRAQATRWLRGRWQRARQGDQALLAAGAAQAARRQAMVKQGRLDPLLPGRACFHQRVALPHLRPQILDPGGRDPRFGQLAALQEHPQMLGIRPVGLGSLLAPPGDARLAGLREVHLGPVRLQLLDHVAPARGALQGGVQLAAPVARQPGPHGLPRPRRDAGLPRFTRGRVQQVHRDLLPVHIQTHYDAHSDPPRAPSQLIRTPYLSRGGSLHTIFLRQALPGDQLSRRVRRPYLVPLFLGRPRCASWSEI